jgi:uncharacterized protein YyaL (SSP411 family)
MARESFEDETVAAALNRSFISVKVDREERPDIDGVYMRACQAMTGSGGWPASLFLTADGKPFFAGTYFPKDTFLGLLEAVVKAWKTDRTALLSEGERTAALLSHAAQARAAGQDPPIEEAVSAFRRSFDREYGGFGSAPKFPAAHNLMFLLRAAPELAETTLRRMFLGGMFDHIGGGFSRYSTDRYWLVPHFEKMLYDNALLAMAYLQAYELTGRAFYENVARRVLLYLEREMKAPGGGFFSSQDADSEGVEGKYYLWEPDELVELLGREDGERFCRHFGITREGNYEVGSVPNLLGLPTPDPSVEALISKVYEYRLGRPALRTDTKILTSWNALAAAAFAAAARVLKDGEFLQTARKTLGFMEKTLTDADRVYAGVTDGVRSGPGFLDDYAFYAFALIQMHQATMEEGFLDRAADVTGKTVRVFWDEEEGGFFFSGMENERLIARPKESFDNAMPSGNSVMAYNLGRLAVLAEEGRFGALAKRQRDYMNGEASAYPAGFGFYLFAALPAREIVCALKRPEDLREISVRSDWIFRVTGSPRYPLLNDRTTFYVCENGACRPPVNELQA